MRNTAAKLTRPKKGDPAAKTQAGKLSNKSSDNPPEKLPGMAAPNRLHRAGQGLQQMLRDAAACVQDRCESGGSDEETVSYRFQKQFILWLTYVGKRLRDSNIPPRCYRIALASLLSAVLLTYGMRDLLEVDSSLFFLGAVVVSAATGGLRAGLLTTLLALLPCAWFLGHPTHTPYEINTAFASLILFTLMALVTCVLSDSLYVARQQADAARQQAEKTARRSRFLAQASAMLDGSQEYDSLLGQVTRAIVPAFADWATVDMLDQNQTLCRVAATHLDLEKEALLRSLRQQYPIDLHEDHPLANALRTGQGELVADVTEAQLQSMTTEEGHRAIARFLSARSFICMPLSARGRVLGVLTLASTSSERRYTPTDMAVVRDLAMRVGLAVDNLRLYQEAQNEIAERAQMELRIREYAVNLEKQRWELEEANARLAEQVNTDGLTGLNNHRAFQETLQKEFGRARRYSAPLSLLLLDVDRFKQYNDTYGHPAGDRVLRQVAAVLRDNARATDFVARYGGEEFVVVLPDTNETGAMQIAERLRQAVEAMTGLDRLVTASFGAATLASSGNEGIQETTDSKQEGPGDITAASELIALADKALYASKHEGRNRVTHARNLLEITACVTGVRETFPAQSAAGILAPPLSPAIPAELTRAYEATITGWSRLLNLRDGDTEDHSQRVLELTLRIARDRGMSEEEMTALRRGALLHDIGKIAIPDSILRKPGPLTGEEWEIMRQHPIYADEMLSQIEFLRDARDIPYSHHEKWDGSGYPRGLKAEQIPLAARIFAVADVWDALRSDRPYRPGWPEEKVIAHIRAEAGRHFDPAIVQAFLAIIQSEQASVALSTAPPGDACIARVA